MRVTSQIHHFLILLLHVKTAIFFLTHSSPLFLFTLRFSFSIDFSLFGCFSSSLLLIYHRLLYFRLDSLQLATVSLFAHFLYKNKNKSNINKNNNNNTNLRFFLTINPLLPAPLLPIMLQYLHDHAKTSTAVNWHRLTVAFAFYWPTIWRLRTQFFSNFIRFNNNLQLLSFSINFLYNKRQKNNTQLCIKKLFAERVKSVRTIVLVNSQLKF